ncbi:MAG: sigma-70 family RNA polymerase sigma factor [Tannerellaceae bacterium]|nr:sigma-70 family RNA polymerase sigma factor [Tannerellaceae bacterium]
MFFNLYCILIRIYSIEYRSTTYMLANGSDTYHEKELWDKFLSGDDKAYTHLYKKYVRNLFSYGMRFTTDRELVKDCIQDVFVKIYSNRKQLNTTPDVKIYLLTALKNTLFNVFEKESKAYTQEYVEPVFHTEYSIEDTIIRDEQDEEKRQKMVHILELLTPRQKEVIYYRFVEGLKINEICTLMDMNVQSVQNLIQRSIRKVRKTFEGKKNNTMNINLKKGCL